MTLKDLDKYIIELDRFDISLISVELPEKGIDKFLSQIFVYLDCSRIIQNMRMMQTIGYPYKREISRYLYLVNMIEDEDKRNTYINNLLDLHAKNLEYEKENPPIIYDKEGFVEEKQKNNKKHARKRKYVEQTIPGFGKEVNASQSLKAKLAGCANVKFTLKPPKK